MSGAPTIFTERRRIDRSAQQCRRRRARGGALRTKGRSYSGAWSPSSLIGRSATTSPWRTDAEAEIVGRVADHGEVEAPFPEDRLGLGLLLGARAPSACAPGSRRASSRRRSCRSSRQGTVSRSSSMPRSPLAPISTAEQVRPAAPHVLDRDDGAASPSVRGRLRAAASREGIADLHGRALLLRSASSNSAEAMVAPWTPSRPVLEPR